MDTVIPAAGRGSRLDDFTNDRPKGLDEVAGRPFCSTSGAKGGSASGSDAPAMGADDEDDEAASSETAYEEHGMIQGGD